MTRTKLLLCAVLLLAGTGLLAPRDAHTAQEAPAATFTNSAPIGVSDADFGGPGNADAYPSNITVAGLAGTVTDVNVTLTGLTHTWPDDLGLLLVGPGGQNLVIQSDIGSSADVSNITYTIDDQSASIMPDNGPLTSGTFRPTSVTNDEAFPAFSASSTPPTTFNQATPAGASTLNGIFGGTAPNGVWKLYVVDSFKGDTGTFSGGWTLNITTTAGSSPQAAGGSQQEQAAVSRSRRQEQAAAHSPEPSAPTASFTNSTALTLTDATAYEVGSASLYPTTIAVSGLSGTITDVNVRLNNLTHAAPDDIGLLLLGPAGQHIILQTDVGGNNAVSNVTYTFDDQAAAGLGNSGPLVSASYKPASVGDDDRFPTTTGAPMYPYKHPAPVGTNTLNAIFGGTDPNGTWRLYAVDAFTGDTGAFNGGWTLDITTTVPIGAILQLGTASYSVSESTARAVINVTRGGETSVAASVDLATSDGTASQRTDYTTVTTTVNFAAGETSKEIVIPITNDNYEESSETVSLTLSAPSTGASLGTTANATLTITNDDTGTPMTNSVNTAQFFVNQHYNDFLSREPDAAGLAYWTGEVTAACGTDPACLSRRIGVSAAFFIELEFQESGAYVYRLYKLAYGEQTSYRPTYAAFVPDRARVVGGASLAQGKLDFANLFASRSEFTARYPERLAASEFVDAILATVQQGASVTFTTAERTAFINTVTSNGRGVFLRDLADNTAFKASVFNRAFVLTQYFGYLKRDPDQDGYDFWLNVLNQQSNNFRGMVCAFTTSTEYQQRFSSVVTRSNSQCVPGI